MSMRYKKKNKCGFWMGTLRELFNWHIPYETKYCVVVIDE